MECDPVANRSASRGGRADRQGRAEFEPAHYSLRRQTVDPFNGSRPSVLSCFNEVQVGGAGPTAFYDLQSVQV